MSGKNEGKRGRPYLYIWEFQTAEGKEAEFQQVYGPEGEWVRLFRRGAGYEKTLLLKDLDRPRIYTTVDIWASEEAFSVFRETFAAEFEALDQRCEELTEKEVRVGRFELL